MSAVLAQYTKKCLKHCQCIAGLVFELELLTMAEKGAACWKVYVYFLNLHNMTGEPNFIGLLHLNGSKTHLNINTILGLKWQ